MSSEKNSKYLRTGCQENFKHDKARKHFQKQFRDRFLFNETQLHNIQSQQQRKSLKRHAFTRYARKCTIKPRGSRLSAKVQNSIFSSKQSINGFLTQQNTSRCKPQVDQTKQKPGSNYRHLKNMLNTQFFVSKKFRPSINTRLPGYVTKEEDAILQSQIQLPHLQLSKNSLGISQKIYSEFVFNKLKVPIEKPKFAPLNKKRPMDKQHCSFDSISRSIVTSYNTKRIL